jgi:hypothetical protein
MGVRLNRSPSTIYYELSRCQPYQAELAQTDAEYKRSQCGRKTKLSAEVKQIILNHLRLSWSPEMIAHEFKLATKSTTQMPSMPLKNIQPVRLTSWFVSASLTVAALNDPLSCDCSSKYRHMIYSTYVYINI